MPAYVLALRERTKDPREMQVYADKTRAIDYGRGKALAVFAKHESLEGAPFERAIILEFPTVEEAKAWYFGAEYQAVIEHRHRGADYRFLIVEST
jgi:uncharacterized protein (DUF1330 family)